MTRLLLVAAIALAPSAVMADPAVIDGAEAKRSGDTWTFAVTLSHGDTGWDDYADGWRVVSEDGTVLGTRELLHPHVNEQPFTRTLSGVEIPNSTTKVLIEARTNVGDWDATPFEVGLPE